MLNKKLNNLLNDSFEISKTQIFYTSINAVRRFITLKSRLTRTLVSASLKLELNAIHFFVPDKAYNLLYPKFRLSVTYCPSKQNKRHFGVFTPTINFFSWSLYWKIC